MLAHAYGELVRVLSAHRCSALAVPFFHFLWRVSIRHFTTPLTLRGLFTRYPDDIDEFRPLAAASLCVRPCDGYVRHMTMCDYAVKPGVRLDDCCELNMHATALLFSLFPHHFHHVFSPVSAVVERVVPIAGKLVFDPARSVCENRRICIQLRSESHKRMRLVMVGALGVGSVVVHVKPGQYVSKGEHVGFFDVGGSAVVLALEHVDGIVDTSHKDARGVLFASHAVLDSGFESLPGATRSTF